MNKEKFKDDLTAWRFSSKHKKPVSVEVLAERMDYSPSTIWSVLNPMNKQPAGKNFWFQIHKATGGAIKRENYYPKGK